MVPQHFASWRNAVIVCESVTNGKFRLFSLRDNENAATNALRSPDFRANGRNAIENKAAVSSGFFRQILQRYPTIISIDRVCHVNEKASVT